MNTAEEGGTLAKVLAELDDTDTAGDAVEGELLAARGGGIAPANPVGGILDKGREIGEVESAKD